MAVVLVQDARTIRSGPWRMGVRIVLAGGRSFVGEARLAGLRYS
ncbi:Hypothetical protein A7982_02186 [Minicystis rosea]|nr:Hypothetical protein A7982_02186 [Minicystis rosea]